MESKTNKRKKKTKVPNHDPEIFVLPPNILQKLGIQIQQVENNNNEKPTTESTVLEKNKSNNVSLNTTVAKQSNPEHGDANEDVSLMETAALMKNSVFLSPTFAPITPNSIPGELELLARDDETMSPVTSIELENSMPIAASMKFEGTGHLKNNVQDEVSTIPILNCSTNDTVSYIGPVAELISSKITVEVPATEVPEESEAILPDDHLDEAYLSDCSNSNLEPMEKLSSIISSSTNGKKINIISEEILTPFECRNKNSGMSNPLSLACPVSRDTLICSKTSAVQFSAGIRDNFVHLSVNSKITPEYFYQNKNLGKVSVLPNMNTEKDKTNSISEPEIHNDCLSDCIDISVTDIEKHLKENEEILQEFANEIIFNDSSDIINKIEKSENFDETFDKDITDLTDTNNMLTVSQNAINSSLDNSNLCFHNNDNNITTSNQILENENCENYNSGSQLNILHNKVESVVSPQSINNKASMPISDLSTSIMLDTDKDNYMKQNSDQRSGKSLQDKVEEISKYLKQCLNRKPKSLTRANDAKGTSYPRKLEHKNLKTNQGVEKPGGGEPHQQGSSRPETVKTYGKATKRDVQMTNVSLKTTNSKNIEPSEATTLLPNELNTITVSESTLHENFCLCGDFGRMAFYDCDSPYKHIHFWEQRHFNIPPDHVRSMYSDHSNTPDSADSVYNQENDQENDILELANCNICWHAIEPKSDTYSMKECMSNLEKVQQLIRSGATCTTTISKSQNVAQASDIRNESEDKSSTNKQSCIKHEDNSISNPSNETTESIVSHIREHVTEMIESEPEPSEVEILIPIIMVDSNIAESKANEETIQNVTADQEMIFHNTNQLEVSVREGLLEDQRTVEEEDHNKDITYYGETEEPTKSVTENTKESHKPTQVPTLRRGGEEITIGEANDCEQESVVFIEDDPGKTSESKKKNSKKTIEPITKPRRFTFEDYVEEYEVEDNQEQSTKSGNKITKKRRKLQTQADSDDEEPLSIKKARKVQSLDDGKSLEPSNASENDVVTNNSGTDKNNVQCGVCSQVLKASSWFEHIGKEHSYVAWKRGEPVVDMADKERFESHLKKILKQTAGLVCSKCGLMRKYVKIYLKHFNQCESTTVVNLSTVKTENETLNNHDDTDVDTTANTTVDGGTSICGVCNDEVDPKKWEKHNMNKHYNLAWIKGQPPVDATTHAYTVEKLLRQYKDKKKKLVCMACGLSRVSYMGFYAHILTCGKTDEEIEKYKIGCDLCDKRYLFLYKSQHMIAHRDQEKAKERKKLAETIKENEMRERSAPETPTSRRRAAEKARTVIEKINENTTGKYKCDKCSFATDIQEELNRHTCESNAETDEEPFAVSGSDEDDSYDDVDSNISEEEEKISVKKIKRQSIHPSTAKAKALPFVPLRPKQYIFQSGEEHYKTYLSSEELFPEWRNKTLKEVSKQEISLYMPPIKESCKVKISTEKDGDWNTYKQLEAEKIKGVTTVFAGASIHCVAWAAARAPTSSPDEPAFLAVAVHRGTDAPRLPATETRSHPALIQIWDFGNFKSLPKFAFGLAHDHGTVWAMDWCPSGARDDPDIASPRLGLLATACSDGVVYIYSVPYPKASKDSNKRFYKLKPVAELRLTSALNRKVYQASAVKWCKQIGHGFIFVGYSDGTTAHYDLNTESPLLRSIDNNVTVLYPYYDERSHGSCVTDVCTFPCGPRAGATLSGASSGVRLTASPAVRPRRRATHHAAIRVGFEPLFPHVIFASDAAKMMASPPELDWLGAGLQLGSTSALAGCAWCGLCLAYGAPHLRTLRPHPAYIENKKQMIGALEMISLNNKRKKALKEDNLVTIVEPTTYEEAVKKYGIQLKLDKKVRPPVNNRQRDIRPERFPLATPSAIAFCPAPAHHDRVVVATHSGIFFVLFISG